MSSTSSKDQSRRLRSKSEGCSSNHRPPAKTTWKLRKPLNDLTRQIQGKIPGHRALKKWQGHKRLARAMPLLLRLLSKCQRYSKSSLQGQPLIPPCKPNNLACATSRCTTTVDLHRWLKSSPCQLTHTLVSNNFFFALKVILTFLIWKIVVVVFQMLLGW